MEPLWWSPYVGEPVYCRSRTQYGPALRTPSSPLLCYLPGCPHATACVLNAHILVCTEHWCTQLLHKTKETIIVQLSMSQNMHLCIPKQSNGLVQYTNIDEHNHHAMQILYLDITQYGQF